MTPFASPRSRTQLAWIAVAAAWAVLATLAWHAGLISDEWIHFNQVSRMRAKGIARDRSRLAYDR